ncbi:DUF1254 domain-containing protein [Mycobacterium hubeiense]|uniref:DUF1254 domain-containing protein n=1 Tax=Mycobacterium hubeiense TaxID=1867256 RepID=UPI000C7F3DBC|nr:DUF1254 domain-containing protein [Mycobacterium sp. QGD 101]
MAVHVSPDNFIRAESDVYFAGIVKDGGFAKFTHNRELTPPDKQIVIRQNRDTLYSAAVFDLDAGPVTLSLPDTGGRFRSLQIINEDQYTLKVVYDSGDVGLTKDEIGTRYVVAAMRILINPNDPADIAAVHKLQDATVVAQDNPGRFDVPEWDPVSQNIVRDALITLASTLPDTRRMFGTAQDTDPVRRLIGAASAWGGNPEKDALYLTVNPQHNDGSTVYRLTVGEVPVDGFWSVIVYNKDGFITPNPQNTYSLNNITAVKDADGNTTVQFGGCDGGVPNCLPITPGWNYMVRLYRPQQQILDGTWTFPEAQPI